MSRGRNAEWPRHIPWRGWRDVLKRVWREIGDDRVSLVAAGIAFYGLLAIFPAIAALVGITGLLVDPEDLIAQFERIAAVMPQQAANILLDQSREVSSAGATALTSTVAISLILALYSSTKGTAALMQGLNIVYDEHEDRGFMQVTATKLLLAIGLILGVTFALALLVALPSVLALAGLESWALLLRWPILLGVVVLGLAVLYRLAPSRRRAKWRWITPGAVVASISWLIGSALFSWYVTSFASYNQTFGTLGGVVILLTWFWLSAFVVLVGGELDAEMEAQTAKDSTVGEDLPMGERGAVKADTLGAVQS